MTGNTMPGTKESVADPLVDAFLNSDIEVFRSVAYPTEVWKEDLCDVETIHGHAREVFDSLLSQAVGPDHPSKVGRILLLLGESGSGKTHLMRAFRTRTHSCGAGYFGYMQMTSMASNYARYVLRMLIDSLQKPYSPRLMDDDVRGLQRLSNAVAESPGADPILLNRLRSEYLQGAELSQTVYSLANSIVNGSLRTANLDLIRSMLFLQSENAQAHAIVYKYLRGESIAPMDLEHLAGITPLDNDDDALTLILNIGRLIWDLHKACLVLCVDQMEDMLLDKSDNAAACDRFVRAMTVLRQISEQLPSAVVIVSCLEDFYADFRKGLPASLREKIQSNPEPITLDATRNRGEVNDMVAAHLAQLLDDGHDRYLDGTRPIPEELLKSVTGLRSRDVLHACRLYRQRCMAGGSMVQFRGTDSETERAVDEKTIGLEQQWNDFIAAWTTAPPAQDDELIRLLECAIQVVSVEQNGVFRFDTHASGRFLSIVSDSNGISRHAGICNRAPQGGGLTNQVRELRESAADQPRHLNPIIVRSADYRPGTPTAAVAQEYASVVKAGGFPLTINDSDWRKMAAFIAFRAKCRTDLGFSAWQQEMQPLSRVDSLHKLLELDRIPVAPARLRPVAEESEASGQTVSGEEPASVDSIDDASQPADVRKVTTRPEFQPTLLVGKKIPGDLPVTIDMESLKTHAAFLGGSGSGKTTAALNLLEQLLLRNVPVVLVDRKGDLAAFASSDTWNAHKNDPELEERGRQLKESIDVALFTPGHRDGCPLSLSIVPDRIHELPEGDQQIICRSAADALGRLMGYGSSPTSKCRTSILIKAIEVLARREAPITLDTLIHLVYDPDDQLLSALGILHPKNCIKVAEDLQMLRINHEHLFPEGCQTLNADLLFGRGDWAVPGRTRLSIISTKFLGGDENALFWVAQLLLELNRWSSRNPSTALQGVVLFDEADLYLPATSKPATKEPMESLLKRARSAGLGIFLATQSPGDMDYRSRDNIATWMLGRIKEERSIEKLKPLLSSLRVDVSQKLQSQETGQFYFSQIGDVSRVLSQNSFMQTNQLSEAEILELASTSAAGRNSSRIRAASQAVPNTEESGYTKTHAQIRR